MFRPRRDLNFFIKKINTRLSEDMQRSHLFWLPYCACNVPAFQPPAGRVPTAGQAAPEVSRRPACRFPVSCPRLYVAVARRKLGRVHPRDYSKQVKPREHKRLAILLIFSPSSLFATYWEFYFFYSSSKISIFLQTKRLTIPSSEKTEIVIENDADNQSACWAASQNKRWNSAAKWRVHAQKFRRLL